MAVLSLLAPSPLPAQSKDPDLAAGLRQVREGDFEGAVLTLDAVTQRLAREGGRPQDLVAAYVNLAVAFVALDQRTAARQRFRRALELDPKLELGPDRYSPKVLGVFEEARREATAEAASREAKPVAAPKAKSGGSKLPLILLGAGGVVAGAVALGTGGGGGGTGTGEARFTGARFGTPVLDCPDGTTSLGLPVLIMVDAVGGQASTTVTSVSVVLIIAASPSLPSEVGFASSAAATINPSSVPPGAMVSLRVDTSLLCGNGPGDAPRVNEWMGRLTLSTANGPFTLETADRMRVNIP